ncbi:MAG TPA: hypothetical protein VGL42_11480 [Opitutaceae bacterium]|jgi:mono/diheme cytochrome c family protein
MWLNSRRAALAGLVFVLGAAASTASPPWWEQAAPRDLNARAIDLPPDTQAVAIVFLGPDCPLSNASIPTLNRLAAEFGPRGIALFGAYVDPTATLDTLRGHVRDFSIAFPTLDDRGQSLARRAGATYTPEVAVFSPSGSRLYLGRIDDRVAADGSVSRPHSARDDLREVFSAIAAGNAGPFADQMGFGCALPEVPSSAGAGVTWARDVAPILMQNCVECHQPGQIAPFSLLAYRDAAKRAKFIAKVVLSHRMPPWSPDSPKDAFLSERRLTENEIATIVRWAAEGAQAGDLASAPPPPPPPTSEWTLGPPDLIVRMPHPFSVPAGPDDTYHVFVMPFSLAQLPPDVLAAARIPDSDVVAVAAIEVRAGNRRALHHADVFVDTSGEARKRDAANGGNGYDSFGTPGFVPAAYLGGRVPGMVPHALPHGIAASVMPMSGDIALQIHYHATGRVEEDQSEVGIYLLREPARRVMDTLFLRSFSLDIPAGDAHFVVHDRITIPCDCVLMSIFPHMHLLGRKVRAVAHFPDGTERLLVDIPRWNFQWHDRYFYREPFELPAGTRVECEWEFDNSAANAANPYSPPRPVQFGPNSTDEMCECQLGLIPMQLGDEAKLLATRVEKMKEKIAELTPEQRGRYHWADAFNDLSGRQ